MGLNDVDEGYKTYLGDSVYVEIEGGMIKLTTNNGYPDDPRNVIFMEPFVYAALEQWLNHIRSRVSAASDQEGE